MNDKILLYQFLLNLMTKVSGELRQIKAEKAKGNKNFQILVRIEQLEDSAKDLSKIGETVYWDILDHLRKEYKVELKAFKKPEK